MSEPYRDGREGQLCLSTTMHSYFIVQTSKRPHVFAGTKFFILNSNDFIICYNYFAPFSLRFTRFNHILEW